MPTPAPDPRYPALREQVEGILSEGKVHTRQASESEKVETYWHIGDAIQSHLGDTPRAEYGQQTLLNLSKDIGIAESTLGEILLFRRSLPISSTSRKLGWSHIREVLRAPNQDQRLFYLRVAEEGSWSVRQLREAVRADAYAHHADQPYAVSLEEDPLQGRPLKARMGQLYTYRIVSGGNPDGDEVYLDLGFGVTCQASLVGLEGVEPGQVVTVKGAGDTLSCTVRSPRTRRYTYVAWVQRIIDGDTLIAVVDLGLGHQTRPQRFRLRGIDCPELSTLAGRNAREFVRDALSQVSFVVITTHRTDTYGRYLADVRYLPGEPDPEVVCRKGRYLNRELLERRLAKRYVR